MTDAVPERLMARVYASAIFCSTHLDLDIDRLRSSADDRSTPRWSCHIESAYRCALAFSFNEFYEKPIRVQHLLSTRFDASAQIGDAWSDWTLLHDERLGTSSLHLSFCFPTLQLHLADPHCPATESVASFLEKIYQLSEREHALPGGLAELSRVLCQTARHRRNALGISRYIVTSLTCDDAEILSAPSDGARVNFYRLLFQHAQGVDTEVATTMMRTNWGSASFFRLYWQPGGILSVSVPYPVEVRNQHRTWFEPRPPALAAAPFTFAIGSDENAAQSEYPSYDLLPEYPPLRYLAVPAIQYAAAYEETLRAVHEAAFSHRGAWPWRLPWQPKPEVRHLLAANLEGLRLPVVRDLVNQLLQKQLQERTTTASMEMLKIRETTRNVLLSVLAIVLTIVFADYEKFFASVRSVLPGTPKSGAASARPEGKAVDPSR